MKTITITGEDKHIYNILKENRIRAKKYGLEITGNTDFEKPSVTLAKAAAKKEAEKLARRKSTKGKKQSAKKSTKKENKGAESLKTKEEKTQPETK